ncbi:SixA phosphatase family protein [Roseivirga sp.]|uniref:SixA phosphatase family protein n=1 Tax=Roseivirga sp. TaxID=1964215 RepID=UPI002B26C54F|nr:histidine phosphatase family protein [Roseivirga sp.]
MKSNKTGNKKLYIIRHAKSSWGNAHLSDFERPLNHRGENDAPDMGQRLAMKGVKPSLIISSPANRALTTAKVISPKIGYTVTDIMEEERLYHASTGTIKTLLSRVDDEHDSIMIFGHNPGLTYLINEISDFDLDNLPTSAVCGIEFQMESWKDIQTTRGHQFYYDYPKSQ